MKRKAQRKALLGQVYNWLVLSGYTGTAGVLRREARGQVNLRPSEEVWSSQCNVIPQEENNHSSKSQVVSSFELLHLLKRHNKQEELNEARRNRAKRREQKTTN